MVASLAIPISSYYFISVIFSFPEIHDKIKMTVSTVFVDAQLWKAKHPQKRFQNFHQSFVLSTERIKIHQSQPLV